MDDLSGMNANLRSTASPTGEQQAVREGYAMDPAFDPGPYHTAASRVGLAAGYRPVGAHTGAHNGPAQYGYSPGGHEAHRQQHAGDNLLDLLANNNIPFGDPMLNSNVTGDHTAGTSMHTNNSNSDGATIEDANFSSLSALLLSSSFNDDQLRQVQRLLSKLASPPTYNNNMPVPESMAPPTYNNISIGLNQNSGFVNNPDGISTTCTDNVHSQTVNPFLRQIGILNQPLSGSNQLQLSSGFASTGVAVQTPPPTAGLQQYAGEDQRVAQQHFVGASHKYSSSHNSSNSSSSASAAAPAVQQHHLPAAARYGGAQRHRQIPSKGATQAYSSRDAIGGGPVSGGSSSCASAASLLAALGAVPNPHSPDYTRNLLSATINNSRHIAGLQQHGDYPTPPRGLEHLFNLHCNAGNTTGAGNYITGTGNDSDRVFSNNSSTNAVGGPAINNFMNTGADGGADMHHTGNSSRAGSALATGPVPVNQLPADSLPAVDRVVEVEDGLDQDPAVLTVIADCLKPHDVSDSGRSSMLALLAQVQEQYASDGIPNPGGPAPRGHPELMSTMNDHQHQQPQGFAGLHHSAVASGLPSSVGDVLAFGGVPNGGQVPFPDYNAIAQAAVLLRPDLLSNLNIQNVSSNRNEARSGNSSVAPGRQNRMTDTSSNHTPQHVGTNISGHRAAYTAHGTHDALYAHSAYTAPTTHGAHLGYCVGEGHSRSSSRDRPGAARGPTAASASSSLSSMANDRNGPPQQAGVVRPTRLGADSNYNVYSHNSSNSRRDPRDDGYNIYNQNNTSDTGVNPNNDTGSTVPYRHRSNGRYKSGHAFDGAHLQSNTAAPPVASYGGTDRDAVRSGKTLKFTAYVPQLAALDGLTSGKYFAGALNVNPRQTDKGYIKDEVNPSFADYLVEDRVKRNRAVNEDRVVFEVEPMSKWVAVATNYPLPKGANRVDDTDEAIEKDPKKYHRTCRIVYIEELIGTLKKHVCYLRANRGHHKNNEQDSLGDDCSIYLTDRMVRAVPVDPRIPWILIPYHQAGQWIQLPGRAPADKVYYVSIEKWDASSTLPLGRIQAVAGVLGDLETEELIALSTNSLMFLREAFSEEALDNCKCVVDSILSNWDLELRSRSEFNNRRVITIDPSRARDLDDAIHIHKHLGSDGRAQYEIGVHIADVSHFVRPGTPLEEEASKRTTTLYLPHACFPMLPRDLSDDLCSLLPHRARLTASVVFRIYEDGTRVQTFAPEFSKSCVQTCARFSYEEVQEVLDFVNDPANANISYDVVPQSVTVTQGHEWSSIVSDLVMYERVTQAVRFIRMRDESADLNRGDEVRYEMDAACSGPVDLESVQHTNSHEIIEELMLTANRIVAEEIACGPFADYAVVRRHLGPKDTIRGLEAELQRKGIEANFSTAKLSRDTFNLIRDTYEKDVATPITEKFLREITQAEYVIAGRSTSLLHFALGFELYSHFTSPIRRFPDILTHRGLWATLDGNKALARAKQNGVANITEELNSIATKHFGKQVEENEDLANVQSGMEGWCSDSNEIKLRCIKAERSFKQTMLGLLLINKDEPSALMGFVMSFDSTCIHICVPSIAHDSRLKFDGNLCDEYRIDISSIQLPGAIRSRNRLVHVKWDLPEGSAPDAKSSLTLRAYAKVPVYAVPTGRSPLKITLFFVPPFDPNFGVVFEKHKADVKTLTTTRNGLDMGGLDDVDFNDVDDGTPVDD